MRKIFCRKTCNYTKRILSGFKAAQKAAVEIGVDDREKIWYDCRRLKDLLV